MSFEEILFAAQIDTNIATIDLHQSKNIHDAKEQLEKELLLVCQKGAQYAKIVYGIGEGKLKAAVEEYVGRHPLVQYARETAEGGSCIIIF